VDSQKFDNLAKALAMRASRRGAIAALITGMGAVTSSTSVAAQPGCREEGHPCQGNQVCCDGLVCSETGQGSSRRCIAGEPRAQEATTTPVSTAAVTTTLPYRVDISCDYDASLDQTSCLFVGSVEGNAPPVTAVILPFDMVCDDVIEGECDIVEPNDGRSEAYRSNSLDQEGRPRCTLVFAGRVATASSASYWCETESGTFPAEGDGLSCPQETQTTEISDNTGAILVYAHRCPAADSGGDYDWYASCPPDSASIGFQLQTAGDSAVSEIVTASSTGGEPARFLLLDPGAYELTESGGDWCHAESDNTNDEGEVIVKAGQHTNVWIFHCPNKGG
jgi:hypothetical protein